MRGSFTTHHMNKSLKSVGHNSKKSQNQKQLSSRNKTQGTKLKQNNFLQSSGNWQQNNATVHTGNSKKHASLNTSSQFAKHSNSKLHTLKQITSQRSRMRLNQSGNSMGSTQGQVMETRESRNAVNNSLEAKQPSADQMVQQSLMQANFGLNMPNVVNMGGNMGYPSIINNNISGLSINYSNHIHAPHPIQQAQTNSKSTELISAENLARSEYLPAMDAHRAQYQSQYAHQTNSKNNAKNGEGSGAHSNHQSSALSSHRRCRSQSPRNNNTAANDNVDGRYDANLQIYADSKTLDQVDQTQLGLKGISRYPQLSGQQKIQNSERVKMIQGKGSSKPINIMEHSHLSNNFMNITQQSHGNSQASQVQSVTTENTLKKSDSSKKLPSVIRGSSRKKVE